MRLYSGSSKEFISDVYTNQIASKLVLAYEDYYGHQAGNSEVTSWTNSLQFLQNLVEYNQLLDDHVVLEHELPYSTKRIDCLLFGQTPTGDDNVVVIELKQWMEVEDCEVEGNVVTFTGQAMRMVAHPSAQVRGYHYLLKDFVKLFEENPQVNLSSCTYCHNYPKASDSILLSAKFNDLTSKFPVFTKDDFESIGSYLKSRLSGGQGLQLFNRFVTSPIAPSKKLMDHTKHMISGQHVFNLIDEQIVANNTIIDQAKKSVHEEGKTVIIVRGGPGTGKSVIALNAVAELLSKGVTVFHATGSSAFTNTIRKIVGARAAAFFKFFNSFPTHKPNSINVLICDEAHRIRTTSNSRYTPKSSRSNLPQIEELINIAKVSVFFIDDYQIVRPEEIGSSQLIRDAAFLYGAKIYDFELNTQFRCSGSDGYLNWIDTILGIRDTPNQILTTSEKMEFKIFDDPKSLYAAIKDKNDSKPNSARLVAGFCWPWSNPKSDGTLVNDVKIGNFEMPWEGRDGFKLAPGIPEWKYWAFDPNGVNQIGCIYTIQGFEFDYVGVIFGKDLIWNPEAKTWIANRSESEDPQVTRKSSDAEFASYVRNVYRVLFTRGMKGCYVYFLDETTKQYFKERMNGGLNS